MISCWDVRLGVTSLSVDEPEPLPPKLGCDLLSDS